MASRLPPCGLTGLRPTAAWVFVVFEYIKVHPPLSSAPGIEQRQCRQCSLAVAHTSVYILWGALTGWSSLAHPPLLNWVTLNFGFTLQLQPPGATLTPHGGSGLHAAHCCTRFSRVQGPPPSPPPSDLNALS
jgi:hypothetical protein